MLVVLLFVLVALAVTGAFVCAVVIGVCCVLADIEDALGKDPDDTYS